MRDNRSALKNVGLLETHLFRDETLTEWRVRADQASDGLVRADMVRRTDRAECRKGERLAATQGVVHDQLNHGAAKVLR